MDKEKILQASREENQNKDIYELEIINRGQRIGGLIAVVLAFAVMTADRFVLDKDTAGYFLIIVSAALGMFIYKAVKLKRKHEIFVAALYGIAFVCAAVMYILNFVR